VMVAGDENVKTLFNHARPHASEPIVVFRLGENSHAGILFRDVPSNLP